MLIGVEDRTRHVRGVKEPLDLEERLANLISDHIVPRLVPELEIVPCRSGSRWKTCREGFPDCGIA